MPIFSTALSSLSSLVGKRMNSDSEPAQNRGHKKQRAQSGVVKKNVPAVLSNPEGSTNANTVTAPTQNEINKLLMAFVQNHSKIETTDDTPHAYLNKNLYSTTLVDKIMESPAFNYDQRQLWRLATLLFGQEEFTASSAGVPIPSPTTMKTTTTKQRRRLRNWICSTVYEELQQRNLLSMDIDKIDDDWKRAFYYLSSGQVVQAGELVQHLGDDALAAMMVVHFQQEVDVCDPARKQVLYWQERGMFDIMPLYRRKMWYILQGRLGYVDHIKAVMTEGLSWPQALLLYALYGGYHGDLSSGLSDYRTLTSSDGVGVNGIHQLRARKHTDGAPSDCLWYILLQWWSSFTSPSVNNAIYRKKLEMALPLQCRWMLLLHMSPLFEHGSNDLESWKEQWCDELYNTELEYMAIYAALYLSRSKIGIKKLLARREYDKEHYLCRQLQIPSEWIMESKAWFALNHQLYDKEVDYYLEVKDYSKARDAILNHMIPHVFLDGTQIETVTKYLGILTSLFPNDMDLQQTISILHNIHIILNDYPRIITNLTSTPEQLQTMISEVTAAVRSVKSLKELANLEDPLFFSKLAGELVSLAASFMDHEQLNALIEACPVAIYKLKSTVQLLSHIMLKSIAKNTSF